MKSLTSWMIAVFAPLAAPEGRAHEPERAVMPTDAEVAAGRRESLFEIMTTIDHLSQEWNDFDRIDAIVRIAAQRDASHRSR